MRGRAGGEGIGGLRVAVAVVFVVLSFASPAWSAAPRPARIAAISRQVFGARWRVAACIAHYESTDGAHLVNGANLGPWQISVSAHGWVDARRLVDDWLYSARVAYRISDRGTDWSAWGTHGLCGV